MLLSKVRNCYPFSKLAYNLCRKRVYGLTHVRTQQNIKPHDMPALAYEEKKEPRQIQGIPSTEFDEGYSSSHVVLVTKKEPIVLSFEDVPGPKSMKYFSTFRHYLSEIGTQATFGLISFGLNIGALIKNQKPLRNLSSLFDEYGPVVRFVSPMGADVVLINKPDHIQKVFTLEGSHPVRSALDSLEKYRRMRRDQLFRGLYTADGEEWIRQRKMLHDPLQDSMTIHFQVMTDICDTFVHKVYINRNHQDEMSKDLYKEIHKWAFDCMGVVLFAKKFTMLETEAVNNQCDMAWLYQSLYRAGEAVVKCESGFQLWKLFQTPTWNSLVKNCDSLDNLIGKLVLETEREVKLQQSRDVIEETQRFKGPESLLSSMLSGNEKMTPEDISTTVMDMLFIGVNTVTSSMSFLLYYLSVYQKCQRILYDEVESVYPNLTIHDISRLQEETPYLQACIKETLRLAPPIPTLTRILPKNIILDKYNIPRGTLVVMSTRDSALKECNFDDAEKFCPDRWLNPDCKDYHPFASVPFGSGARKCLGQNLAEMMMTVLTMKMILKYKLEYHYGEIQPTKSFIAKPNKQLKIRFTDRI